MPRSKRSGRGRKPADGPKNVLEWHGLYEEDQRNYIRLLKQDAFEPWEAACAIYPLAPCLFDAATIEDGGRMAHLLRLIEDAISSGRLDTFTSKQRTVTKPDDFLDWASRSDLVEEPLRKRIQTIFSSKKRYSGRTIPALRADKEILGAALGILAVEYHKIKCKKVWGANLSVKIEEVAHIYWTDAELPKAAGRPVNDLLNHYLKKLQNEVENGFDYKYLT